MKEFFELKLWSKMIDEYERTLLELLKYVAFIKDETVKIQGYLGVFIHLLLTRYNLMTLRH
jgi:hypothetical protein